MINKMHSMMCEFPGEASCATSTRSTKDSSRYFVLIHKGYLVRNGLELKRLKGLCIGAMIERDDNIVCRYFCNTCIL